MHAFEQPGVLEKTVKLPFGEMPAGVALNIAVFDVLTHAVDIARASGQQVNDTELIETALGGRPPDDRTGAAHPGRLRRRAAGRRRTRRPPTGSWPSPVARSEPTQLPAAGVPGAGRSAGRERLRVDAGDRRVGLTELAGAAWPSHGVGGVRDLGGQRRSRAGPGGARRAAPHRQGAARRGLRRRTRRTSTRARSGRASGTRRPTRSSDVSTPWDAFCAGHAFLPDGRLLVAGGTTGYPNVARQLRRVTNKAFIFDPATSQYEAAPDTAVARWYPTVVELGDGRLFTLGGFNENGRPHPRPARSSTGRAWSARHAAAGGRAVHADVPGAAPDARRPTLLLGRERARHRRTLPGHLEHRRRTRTRTVPGLTKKGLRDEAMSVLLPPAQDQRVMIMGGGGRTAAIAADGVDRDRRPEGSRAGVRRRPADGRARRCTSSAVILPDSTVLQTGGAATDGEQRQQPGVQRADLRPEDRHAGPRPRRSTVPRVYHSSALLLPDGRVATFGGNPEDSFEMRIEIYTPAYLREGHAAAADHERRRPR